MNGVRKVVDLWKSGARMILRPMGPGTIKLFTRKTLATSIAICPKGLVYFSMLPMNRSTFIMEV